MAARNPRGSGVGVTQRFGVVFAWAVVFIIFAVVRPENFPTASNFATLFASQVPLGLAALALLVPLVAGDYDLSVANTLTLSGMVVAVLNVQAHWSIWLAMLAALAVGAAVGLLNGIICVFADIDPFIVTLGTGTFVAGITLWISNSTTVSGASPGLVSAVVIDRFAGISFEFFYLIIVALVIWYILDYTPAGRRALIVGRGREVARLSGLHVRRIRMLSFITAGLISAFGGIVLTGTSGSADPTAGTALLLPAFAAVFLGSTTLYPGRFNPWGTLVAVYFLTTGINGLALLGVSTFVQQLFYGGALVIAVVLASLAGKRRERRAARRPELPGAPGDRDALETGAPAPPEHPRSSVSDGRSA